MNIEIIETARNSVTKKSLITSLTYRKHPKDKFREIIEHERGQLFSAKCDCSVWAVSVLETDIWFFCKDQYIYEEKTLTL